MCGKSEGFCPFHPNQNNTPRSGEVNQNLGKTQRTLKPSFSVVTPAALRLPADLLSSRFALRDQVQPKFF